MLRFNFDANTVSEAKEYVKNRAIQLFRLGYTLKNIITYDWGVDATFIKDNIEYQSLYILLDYRNQGLYTKHVNKTILTSKQCKLENYLNGKGIKYISKDLIPFDEYIIIDQHYNDQKTKRSDVYLMNHIDEGLGILEKIGASILAKKAYCLHPIFQSDEDLIRNIQIAKYVNPETMLRVMEYRSIANDYLSFKKISNIDEIKLSPIKDVNDMLIADKIQNYKDFKLYHDGKHPRSVELNEYFLNWHNKLKINELEYLTIPNYNNI